MSPLQAVEAAYDGLIEIGHGARATIGRDAAAAARRLVDRHSVVAIDCETAGLGPLAGLVKCVTVASPDHAVILDPRREDQRRAVADVLDNAEGLVLHGAAFDVGALAMAGLLRPEHAAKVIDTLVLARMAEPDERTRKSLAVCAARYLGTDAEDLQAATFRRLGLTRSEGYRVFDLDRPSYVVGAALDGILTARLLPLLHAAARSRLLNHPFGAFGLDSVAEAEHVIGREQMVNRVMLARTARGIRVDLEELERYRRREVDQQRAWREVLADAAVNETNPRSLIDRLVRDSALPEDHPRTPTGVPSTKREDLLRIGHPVAEAYTRLKASMKVDSDYLAKVVDLADSTGRVHPQVGVLAAATGRMSVSDPPLHQFPGPARGILLADPGDALTSIDWSQIEPVVIANMARDAVPLAGYEDGTSDLYADAATFARVDRKTAKVVVLASLYGEGRAQLARDLGVSVPRAAAIQRRVFSALPRTEALVRRLRDTAERERAVFTVSGRVLPIPASADGTRVAVHKGVNFCVQGSAYDVLAEAILSIHEAGMGDAIYLTMHDEMVVSTDAADEIRAIMETPPERLCMFAGRTPVLRTDRADLGGRWAAV